MSLSVQQQRYCEARVFQGLEPLAAFQVAYDATKLSAPVQKTRAERLEGHPEVLQHMVVLKARREGKSTSAAGYTKDQAMREADEVLDLAKRKGQAAAAKSAVELKSKLAGLIVEKTETKHSLGLEDADMATLTAIRAEIDARIARNRDALGLIGTPEQLPEVSRIRRIA